MTTNKRTILMIIIGIILRILLLTIAIFIAKQTIFKFTKSNNSNKNENKIIENNDNYIKEENNNYLDENHTDYLEEENKKEEDKIEKAQNNTNNNPNANNNTTNQSHNNNNNNNNNNDDDDDSNENINNDNYNDNEIIVNNNLNSNNLTIDLYYSNTCPHCHAFLEYYNSLDQNIKSKINFNQYEIGIAENVIKYFDIKKKINSDCGGVPFIVFNEEDYMCGFADSLKETFIEKLRHYEIID